MNAGCGKPLAPGQWWTFCGETDMGQTAPVLCTECGGTLKLRDAACDARAINEAEEDGNRRMSKGVTPRKG